MQWKQATKILAAFLGIAFLVYGRSVFVNDFVALDDDILITENAAVQEISPASLRFIATTFDPELYIPLTFLSYQFDHVIWGLNPVGFHLTNLLLHVANAVLVFLVVRQLWDPTRRGQDLSNHHATLQVLTPALLFLIHPLNTETVAWAAARKDVLSSFFFLLSLFLYLRCTGAESCHPALGPEGSGPEREPARLGRRVGRVEGRSSPLRDWTYWAGVIAFALALLAKVSVLMLPVVLILVDTFARSHVQAFKRANLKTYTPYFLLSVIFGAIALLGKQTTLSLTSLPDALLIATRGTMFYLQKLIWPLHLSVLYPVEGEVTLTDPTYFVPLLFLFFLFLFLFLCWRKQWRTVTSAIVFFLLMLAPSFMNIAKGGDLYFASDRYVYLASIGVFVIIAHGLRCLSPRIVAPVTLIVIMTLSVLTFRQSLLWRNTETLFSNVLHHYPNSHLAHSKVGAVLFERGKIEEAVDHFRTSLALKENPRAYFNLGIVAIAQGDFEAAWQFNEAALALDPTYAPAYENIGFLHYREGKVAEAIAAFERALALHPLSHTARENLRAIRGYERAL